MSNKTERTLAALFLAGCLLGGGPVLADAEAPGLVLSFTGLDTMSLAETGAVAGVTWLGPDTLAVLEDIPDTLSESGDREVHLVFRDRAGEILLQEDFTGVLDRALAWDGEFLYSSGDADDGSPYRPGDLNSGVVFDRLPAQAEIRVYTVSGEHVRTFSSSGTGGRLQWDAKTEKGADAASGIYFAVIKGPDGNTAVRKIAVIR